MVKKTITLSIKDYKNHLENFLSRSLNKNLNIIKGKDVYGNYIYTSTKESYTLYQPKYQNYPQYMNQLISSKNELITQLNNLYYDIITSESDIHKDTFVKINNKLKKINEEINYINDTYNENIEVSKGDYNKYIELEKNTVKTLKTLYDNKNPTFNINKDEWISINKQYLDELKNLELIRKKIHKLNTKNSSSLDNIMIKEPYIEYGTSDIKKNIFYKYK